MSKQLYRIENALMNNIWCIKPDVYYSIIKQLQSHYKGEVKADLMDGDLTSGEPTILLDIPANVAFISIDGTLGKHLSLLETACGGVDYDSISAQLMAANADTNIDSVLIYINSPGGMVVGLQETAQLIAEVAANKDVICYVDCMCASAAYWLASQCTAIYCAPSAFIGNVGAYNVLVDETAALAKAGMVINCIQSDPLKTAGAPWEKLSDEAKALFQARIDNMKADFVSAIQSKRQVSDDVLKGWIYSGNEAVENNLVDGTLDNINDLVSSLANN